VKTCSRCKRSLSRTPGRIREITTNSLLRKLYGLTLKEFLVISAAQNDVCAICDNKCTNYSRLSVDHDHDTGKIRGLLCNRCNRAMGLFQDNPDILRKAATYLEANGTTGMIEAEHLQILTMVA
jgi:hypothetical protein